MSIVSYHVWKGTVSIKKTQSLNLGAHNAVGKTAIGESKQKKHKEMIGLSRSLDEIPWKYGD